MDRNIGRLDYPYPQARKYGLKVYTMDKATFKETFGENIKSPHMAILNGKKIQVKAV